MSFEDDLLPPLGPEKFLTIRLIVNGIGQMGKRGLLTALSMKDYFQSNGINLEVAAIVDLYPEPRAAAEETCTYLASCLSLKADPVYASSLEEAAALLRHNGENTDDILIYDATPAEFRMDNLTIANEYRMILFAEKPLVDDEQQLKGLAPYNFYCDLIENQNVAFRTLVEAVQNNRITITKLKFWRHGSTAFRFFRDERKGIEGGALLDKGPHDISLTMSLLGLYNIRVGDQLPNVTVLPGGGGCFVFADVESIDAPSPKFMAVRKRSTRTEIDGETADARFDMEIDWELKDRSVVSSQYSFSWIGVSQSLRDEMLRLGLEEQEWLGSAVVDPCGPFPGYRSEEARICVLEGHRDGENLVFVANFLAGLDVTPAVWQITKFGRRKIGLVRLRFGENSFARILKTVVSSVLHGTPCHIDRTHADLVHRVLFQVRQTAFNQEIDYSTAVQRSREAFRSGLLFENGRDD